jgi:hypothetical protein
VPEPARKGDVEHRGRIYFREIAMRYRLIAFGLALACGAATAHAQTVISRQITDEPVETVITRTPTGTIVTKRPLPAAPIAAPSPGVVEVRPYGSAVAPYPPAFAGETTGVGPAVETLPAVETVATGTTATRRVTTARAERRTVAKAVTRTPTRARTVATTRTRTVRRTVSAPLDLTPAQQRVVYQTVVDRRVYAPAAPVAVAPPATVYTAPAVTGTYAVSEDVLGSYAAVEPAPAYAVAPYPAAARVYPARYAVGSVLPRTVALAPLPDQVVLQIPSTQGYHYALVNDRVLLVDPITGVIVADVTGY